MKTHSFTFNDTAKALSLPINKPAINALVLVHGRGATALDILQITKAITIPDTCIVIAPQAPNNTWYQHRFIEPQTVNEPELSQSLMTLASTCEYIQNKHSVRSENITLAGFSQGACLVAEFLKHSPKKYNAVAMWSGGLIGTDKEVTADLSGSFDELPVYIGCDEADFHIPKERVLQTSQYFTEHNAKVTLELYKNLGHAIHPNGLRFVETHLG